VTGQIADRRAHWTAFSTVVVRMGISKSGIVVIYRRRSPLQSKAPLRQT
jgi:hypothetical protein